MYKIISEFITENEQKYIKDFVNKRIQELGGKLKTYSEHEQMFLLRDENTESIFKRINDPISFFSIAKDINKNKEITNIVRRMQDTCNVSYENPETYFNWVISLCQSGGEVLCHLDPLDTELLKTKKIVRMNIIVQNAKRGGTFDLQDANTKNWVTADIPDKALMIFDASDIYHRISKNLSNVTRINLSIDAVVDR